MGNTSTNIRCHNNGLAVSIALNILLSYALLAVCRVIFFAANYDLYSAAIENNSLWLMFKGSMVFDTSAVCYLNIAYLVLLLLPCHFKEGRIMDAVVKWSFIIPNAIGVIANLCDCVYIRYTGRRTTWDIFNEFSNDGNIGKVIAVEMVNSWWLVVIGIVLIIAIYKFSSFC